MTHKILVIRFSSIGDIVLTTPVIRTLHQQLDAEVHLLTKASFKGVLSANPYVHKIWAIKSKVSEVLADLKQEGFTQIIDLHANLRSLQVKWGLFGVKAYTFDKLNWQKWLLVKFKVNKMPDIHIVDRYLATTKALGIKNDGKGLDHFIPTKDEVNPADYGLPKTYIALVTGAAHATKRLPQEKIIELCQQIKAPIVLLGGPDEQAQGDAIRTAAGEHVINACGHTRLHQSASLLQQATCVISHDTGLMHMAAAFNKPIYSIWGNTVPDLGMYPYKVDENYIFEVQDLSCRPCSKIGFSACPKGHFSCMQAQSLTTISKQISSGL